MEIESNLMLSIYLIVRLPKSGYHDVQILLRREQCDQIG